MNNGAEISVQDILDRGSREIEQKLSNQPEVRAQLMVTMGVVNRNMGRYDQAKPLLEDALAYWRTRAAPGSDEAAGVLLDLAEVVHEQGDYAQGALLARESLELRLMHHGSRHELVADARQSLGAILTSLGETKEAGDHLRLAEAVYRELGSNSKAYIQCLNNLGNVATTDGDHVQVQRYLGGAVARMRKRVGPDTVDPDLHVMLQNLGLACYFLDDLDGAVRYYSESVAMGRVLYRGDHLTLARGLSGLGHMAVMEGRYQDAVEALTEATAMYKPFSAGIIALQR